MHKKKSKSKVIQVVLITAVSRVHSDMARVASVSYYFGYESCKHWQKKQCLKVGQDQS